MSVAPKPDSPQRLAIVEDVTCTCCGCACDDIDVTIDDNRVVAAERACFLAEPWFLEPPNHQRARCLIAGKPAEIDEGIERAARILTEARYPLVYGLSDTTCEAQRVAVAIADWIGGNVDTTTSHSHGPAGVSFQGVGEVTCSLGEVANRGDLIVIWGADPAASHPRHFSRYSLEPHGMFVPGGRADRTCVVVDVRKTKSAGQADLFLSIKPGADFEALWTLRGLAAGLVLDARAVENDTGVPLAAWHDLMRRMKAARFGVMLVGRGLMMTRGRYLNHEALLALVRDMDAHTRFVAMALRDSGNLIGADSVLTWRTGYPFGVNLSRGYPRFNPGEYTAEEMLSRGEVDAALVVADDPMSSLSRAAREHLARIGLVALDARETATTRAAAVAFTTARYGIETSGTVYRMDDVPLPLRPALESPYASDFEVLAGIERRVQELKNADG
jgi:formylmethanofuran dehydrogenase subunit B